MFTHHHSNLCFSFTAILHGALCKMTCSVLVDTNRFKNDSHYTDWYWIKDKDMGLRLTGFLI